MSRNILLKLLLFCCLNIFFVISSTGQIISASSNLNELNDIIDNDFGGQTSIHSISFALPIEAQMVKATDYIRIIMPNFTQLTQPLRITGAYTGNPQYSVGNQYLTVTGISLIPGAKITIEGITAKNPFLPSQFLITVAITEDENGQIVNNISTTMAKKHPGTVKVTANVDTPSTRLQFSGFTGPGTYVIFSEGEAVIGSDVAGPTGYFSKVFPSMVPGSHTISLYGVDLKNRATSITPFEVYAPVYQTVQISNVLLSPTISIGENEINVGETLIATGSAFPGSQITIFTDSPVRNYVASTSATGVWTYSISDTQNYLPGDYRIYALSQLLSGIQSLTSPSQVFSIRSNSGGTGSACGDISHGDLNCDDIVNLADFSILMYYWGTMDAQSDINLDNTVDLIDFSIMMFYWGT